MAAENPTQLIQRLFRPDIAASFTEKAVPLSELARRHFFRNQAELDDVQASIRSIPQDHLVRGIVGSRTRGRLVYTTDQVLNRLYWCSLVPHDVHEQIAMDRRVDSKFYEQVEQITLFLQKKARGVINLDDIDFETLPPDLRDLLRLNYYERNRTAHEKNPRNMRDRDRGNPQALLRPAALVPDIDIAFVTPEMKTDNAGFKTMRQSIIVGQQSGTAIHLLEIAPGSYDSELQYNDALVSAQMAAKQFVAFR